MTKNQKADLKSISMGLKHIADVLDKKTSFVFRHEISLSDALKNYANVLANFK